MMSHDDENKQSLLLTKHAKITKSRVDSILSYLFFDDIDDPCLSQRSKTWLNISSSTVSFSKSEAKEKQGEEEEEVIVKISANGRSILFARKKRCCFIALNEEGSMKLIERTDYDDDDFISSLDFLCFDGDDVGEEPFLMVGRRSGRVECFDCSKKNMPLLFTRKISRTKIVSIHVRTFMQRIAPKRSISRDIVGSAAEDVTVFSENGDVFRICAVELRSECYRLRKLRNKDETGFRAERDDMNTLSTMVKFDSFTRIAPIKSGVCLGNVPMTASQIGLRENTNKKHKSFFNTSSSNSSSDDDNNDNNNNDEKFGYVCSGRSAIASIIASGGSEFGAAQAVAMAAKKVFSFVFSKSLKKNNKNNNTNEKKDDLELVDQIALKPSKWKTAIIDGPRKINKVLLSPGASILVATDLLGRVTVYDVKYGILTTLSLIKGCRDTEVGFPSKDGCGIILFNPHKGGGALEYFPSKFGYAKPAKIIKEVIVGRGSRLVQSSSLLGTLFATSGDEIVAEEIIRNQTNVFLLGPSDGGSLDIIAVS